MNQQRRTEVFEARGHAALHVGAGRVHQHARHHAVVDAQEARARLARRQLRDVAPGCLPEGVHGERTPDVGPGTHINIHILDPRFLSQLASYDVASIHDPSVRPYPDVIPGDHFAAAGAVRRGPGCEERRHVTRRRRAHLLADGLHQLGVGSPEVPRRQLPALGDPLGLGPGGCCSSTPRHGMPIDSRNEGLKCG